MPPLILPNAAATFGLPLLACPLLPCSILTVLRVGRLIPRFGVSIHGPKHSIFTKTPWRAASTGYWSWVVEASSFGSCFLLCISEALDFWWVSSFHDHSLVKVLTEFHLHSNAKVGETHCVFALAADMTLSHIFFWGSKEERVNEWSQRRLKKMKNWSTPPSCGQIQALLNFRGLPSKRQACDEQVEAERWVFDNSLSSKKFS